MRIASIVLAFVALVAVPVASAMDDVTVTAPEANVHVDGTTVAFDSTNEAGILPAGVVGEVTIQDIDLSVSESRCAVPTDVNPKDHEQTTQACQTGDVQTGRAPTELVEYRIDVLLPEPQRAGAEEPEQVSAESAVVEQVLPTQTVLLAAAAASASAGALYGVWRFLKWTGLAALVPLYSHISDDEILDDENRGNIYRLIQSEAGISTKDIADRLGLAWGTVTHHLNKLEKRRFVVSKKYGKYRRYFANGAGGSDQKDALAVLRVDRTGDIAALIRAQPGLSQKAVSEILGVSSSTILWHVKRLQEVDLIRKVRDGKTVRYYPGEGLQGVSLITPPPAPSAA